MWDLYRICVLPSPRLRRSSIVGISSFHCLAARHPAFLKISFFLLGGMFQRNIHVEELRACSDLKTKLENSSISKSYDQNEFSIVFL